jgi:hypothetical protein
MITLIGLVFKVIKWAVIAVAYLLVGLTKLVTIVVVLIFFTARAGVRRLLDAKGRKDDDEADEYDLGYPSSVGRSSVRLTQDAFDARWQRERDLRIAERRPRQVGGGDRLPTPTPTPTPATGERDDEMGNAAVQPPLDGRFESVAGTANGFVDHGTRERRWDVSERSGQGATVIRP